MKARSGSYDNDPWGSARNSRSGSKETLNTTGYGTPAYNNTLNGCKDAPRPAASCLSVPRSASNRQAHKSLLHVDSLAAMTEGVDAGQSRSRPCRRDGQEHSGSEHAACCCCGSDLNAAQGCERCRSCACGGAAAAVMELHLRLAGPFMVARTRNSSHWDCHFLFLVPAQLPDTQRLLLPSAQSSCRQDRVFVFFFSSSTPPSLSLSLSSSIINHLSVPPPMSISRACSRAHSHSCRPMSWFIYEL